MAKCAMISEANSSAAEVRPACLTSVFSGLFADTSNGVSFFAFFRFFSFVYYYCFYGFGAVKYCSTVAVSQLWKRMFCLSAA